MLHSGERKKQSFVIEFTLDLVAETPAESLGRGHTGLNRPAPVTHGTGRTYSVLTANSSTRFT